jgi:hypothetical protein
MGQLMKASSLAVVLAIASVAGNARGDSVVVPNGLANVDGNSNNTFPFHNGGSSMRYQQVFDGAAFGSSPITITGIAFRPDLGAGDAFTSTISNIQINLSTTSRSPDNLSTTFANNVGADDTVVRSAR